MASRPSDRERRAAANPDTPAAELLALASRCPEEILSNPVMGLLSLAEPGLWQRIDARARAERAERAIRAAILSAAAAVSRSFAAECLCRAIVIWKQQRPASAEDADKLVELCRQRAAEGAHTAEGRAGKALVGRLADLGRRRGDPLAARIGQAGYPLFEQVTRERLEGAARAAGEVAAHAAELLAVDEDERAVRRANERESQLSLLQELATSTPGRIDLETARGGQLGFRF